jgi:hypothetical protein
MLVGRKRKDQKASDVPLSKIRQIYQIIYPDVNTFLASRKRIFEDDETNVKDSFSLNAKAADFSTGRKPSEHDREISLILLT